MTTAAERQQSINMARELMEEILQRGNLPGDVRNSAQVVLRHYPDTSQAERMVRYEEQFFLTKPIGDLRFLTTMVLLIGGFAITFIGLYFYFARDTVLGWIVILGGFSVMVFGLLLLMGKVDEGLRWVWGERAQ